MLESRSSADGAADPIFRNIRCRKTWSRTSFQRWFEKGGDYSASRVSPAHALASSRRARSGAWRRYTARNDLRVPRYAFDVAFFSTSSWWCAVSWHRASELRRGFSNGYLGLLWTFAALKRVTGRPRRRRCQTLARSFSPLLRTFGTMPEGRAYTVVYMSSNISARIAARGNDALCVRRVRPSVRGRCELAAEFPPTKS